MGKFNCEELLNQSKYRLTDLSTPEIEKWRSELKIDGLLVLPDFLSETGLKSLMAEAQQKAANAFYKPVVGNVYLSEVDESWPENHPGRRMEPTEVGVVAADQFDADSPLRALFEADSVMEFIAAIVGRGPLYRYECPLGYINLAVMRAGNYLRWHFDQSDFVVSIPLQSPISGGRYEYVRNLRTAENDAWHEIHKVLDGDRSRVKQLDADPGSLVLFEGRYTAHRVTPIEGDRPRIGALLGYVDKPGMSSTPHLRQIRYGREC